MATAPHPTATRRDDEAKATTSRLTDSSNSSNFRRLVVDTDLGLDDLVALAILCLHQCLIQPRPSLHGSRFTAFRIIGVTLTEGISHANAENAALIRRMLPPGTPVYVGASRKYEGSNHGEGNDFGMMGEGSDKRIANHGLGSKRNEPSKPIWWTRTAHRVTKFLSSLPHLPLVECMQRTQEHEDSTCITAEQFLANAMDDPRVDILCLAPLSTVARALNLRAAQCPRRSPQARFFIMGGIRRDSQWTKRGESTAPFGYRDIEDELRCESSLKQSGKGCILGCAFVDGAKIKNSISIDALAKSTAEEQVTSDGKCETDESILTETSLNTTSVHSSEHSAETSDENVHFGEFNFSLDISAARTTLSRISAHIIPLEACTLVPKSCRSTDDAPSGTGSDPRLSLVLSSWNPTSEEISQLSLTEQLTELQIARRILLQLLNEYGTNETQWDSISAAIYCNVFGSSRIFDLGQNRHGYSSDVSENSTDGSAVGDPNNAHVCQIRCVNSTMSAERSANDNVHCLFPDVESPKNYMRRKTMTMATR